MAYKNSKEFAGILFQSWSTCSQERRGTGGF